MNQVRAGQIRWDKRNQLLYMVLDKDQKTNMWVALNLLCFINAGFYPMGYMRYHTESIRKDELFDEPN
jgi:hypothetical protein